MKLDVLERELEAKKQEGIALLSTTAKTAEAENRVFTEEERGAIERITADARIIQTKIAGLKKDQGMLDELTRLGSVAVAAAAPARAQAIMRKSLGQQFVDAPEFEFF